MHKKLFYLIFIVSAGIIFYSGCKDTITGQDLDKRIIPGSNVSFSQHIQPVFNIKCANSGCHEDAARAGGVSLTTWANVTSDPGIVFPGAPQSSRLVWTIDPQYASTKPMPPIPYPSLTANQLAGIKTWIKEGAKNN